MSSLVLRTTARFLLPLMLLFSIFLLLRGHNEPGGGFIAGLVAAAAFALHGMAHGVPAARSTLRFEPRSLIGAGLLVALASGLLPVLTGLPFLTGLWTELSLPLSGSSLAGTPVIFDLGVFLVVLGVTLMILFSLAEE